MITLGMLICVPLFLLLLIFDLKHEKSWFYENGAEVSSLIKILR